MPEPATTARATRPLLVCADDFGLSPGIDRAIAELIRRGRLGAFSCLSSAPAWAAAAAQVAGLRRQALAGLHFNLSEGTPLSPALARHWPQFPSLPRLILLAHARLLPLAALAQELAAQWAAFTDLAGADADFIDGHQHVHHLPGVRPLVLALAQRHGLALRSTGRVLGPGDGLKRWLIEHSGGRALARQAGAGNLVHNRVLLGAYDFIDPDYRARMRGWLAAVPAAGGLLFCHPGGSADANATALTPDPIAPARLREAAYLGSDDFLSDLDAAGVRLSKSFALAE